MPKTGSDRRRRKKRAPKVGDAEEPPLRHGGIWIFSPVA